MSAKSRILIVDDDAVVRHAYQRSLASTNCNVVAVWSGEEALRAMERESFDLVLLDIRMPGADGISVLRQIKQCWPDSEVIIITGFATIESAKEAIRLGAHNYLAKPIGPADVVNAAANAIHHKKWALRREPADSNAIH